jgi:hypothetical protein
MASSDDADDIGNICDRVYDTSAKTASFRVARTSSSNYSDNCRFLFRGHPGLDCIRSAMYSFSGITP